VGHGLLKKMAPPEQIDIGFDQARPGSLGPGGAWPFCPLPKSWLDGCSGLQAFRLLDLDPDKSRLAAGAFVFDERIKPCRIIKFTGRFWVIYHPDTPDTPDFTREQEPENICRQLTIIDKRSEQVETQRLARHHVAQQAETINNPFLFSQAAFGDMMEVRR
jgi:hypothetical protein